ncbi:MAG: DUF4175 family protein [Chitinophagaceae bacterium]|nr:MAG: DUF4175 family protein [Chitinophagaceae bacterium]
MSGNTNLVITELQKRWRRQHLLTIALLSIAVALPVVVVLHFFMGISAWWLAPVTMLFFLLTATLYSGWRIEPSEVARILNNNNPELEESAGLLLKPSSALGMLETLQVKKLGSRLQHIAAPRPVDKHIKTALVILVVSFMATAGLYFLLPVIKEKFVSNANHQPNSGINERREKILPAVAGVTVQIQPPAYTGIPPRNQTRFNIKAEQGSRTTWKLSISGEPSQVALIFNDSTRQQLTRNTDGVWAGERTLKTNGFYQLIIDDQASEFYQLEAIADKPPVITVQTPRPATIIEYGQPQQVNLSLNITDDYGISDAVIFATIASGNGESVKFREEKLTFSNFRPGGAQYKLTRPVSLPALKMQPGDELYFYISATDNFKQEARSDIYSVKMEDTASLMSMDGMMTGVDLKPEFFRSQRQIIIETEQLLKGRDTMSVEAFNNRCNDLGIDQKLLRLRYGKFLGEENETNIGEDGNDEHEGHEHEEGHAEISIEDFNNADKIIDQYAHKHDIAEDATFFDPQTKAALKATLAEMWEAELRLRTYKPKEALPYEYKALRLLKELQQKSREYVPKTSTKLPPLKPGEKRLTGELDKILEPNRRENYKPGADKIEGFRQVLSILSRLKENPSYNLTAAETSLLEAAAGELSLSAGKDPSSYLGAFEASKKLLAKQIDIKDLAIIEKAVNRLIRSTEPVPAERQQRPDNNLSRDYFINLKSASTP